MKVYLVYETGYENFTNDLIINNILKTYSNKESAEKHIAFLLENGFGFDEGYGIQIYFSIIEQEVCTEFDSSTVPLKDNPSDYALEGWNDESDNEPDYDSAGFSTLDRE